MNKISPFALATKGGLEYCRDGRSFIEVPIGAPSAISRFAAKRRGDVDIICPKCGTENWLENQNRCFACNAVLRRCADCVNYDSRREWCRALDSEIGRYEAENPSLLSISTNCMGYRCARPTSRRL